MGDLKKDKGCADMDSTKVIETLDNQRIDKVSIQKRIPRLIYGRLKGVVLSLPKLSRLAVTVATKRLWG